MSAVINSDIQQPGTATQAVPPAQAANERASPLNTNLIVHHLYQRIRDEDVMRAFAPFGDIVSAIVQRDINTGKSKCMAFVCFRTHEAATNAISNLHLSSGVLGKKITVRWADLRHNAAERAAERADSRELFVRNIPLAVNGDELMALVGWLGPVGVQLCDDTEPDAADPRRIAFIAFGTAAAAQQALHYLHGRCRFESCGGVPLLCKLKEDYQRGGDATALPLAVAAPVAVSVPTMDFAPTCPVPFPQVPMGVCFVWFDPMYCPLNNMFYTPPACLPPGNGVTFPYPLPM